ncbi:MAG: GGDEF domain-containing protein [Burkholderiales bacterium]|nr:GGDEF domain-containing protein [Burkholderiales bacterium]
MHNTARGTVAWLGSNAIDARSRRRQSALRSEGWRVRAAAEGVAEVRVAECRSADDIVELRQLVKPPAVPLLVLVSTPDLLLQALRAVRETDDVALADEPPAALAARLERLLARRAPVDALTGLETRSSFDERLQAVLTQPSTENGVLALALLDMDHFKGINDRLGHVVGDQVLAAAGSHLRRILGPLDRCARWGGEEFALLLRRDSFEALRVELGSLLRVDVTGVGADVGRCSLSIGATLCSPLMDARTCFDRAGTALYESKARGRERLTFYEALLSGSADEDAGHAVQLRHFENVTQVVTQRVANLVSAMGQNLMRALQAEARRDALTGVANRGQFDRRIAREMARAARDGRPLALLFFDIDEFGRFNREHGATVGDTVLRHFVQTLNSGIRPVDWIARYGGEEFCVVMPAGIDEAAAAAERIRGQVEASASSGPDGRELRVTTSVGVAAWAGAAEAVESWVLRASTAVQAAKRAGRNRVVAAADPGRCGQAT